MHCDEHLTTDGRATRRILNEAQAVVYFPHSAGNKIRYLLENYVGVDKKQITKFKRMNTRVVTIIKNYPQVYMTQNEIGLLNDEDNINLIINIFFYLILQNTDHFSQDYTVAPASVSV